MGRLESAERGLVGEQQEAAGCGRDSHPGFAEGCHKIHTHGDIEMYIPAYLGYDYSKYQTNEYSEAEGYGSEGNQSYIPPYSTLIYSLHLCGISE